MRLHLYEQNCYINLPTQNCLRYTAAACVSPITERCPIDQWKIHKLCLEHLQIVHKLEQAIHCLHDFAHKQDSQLNSSVLITVWRVVIEV